jgi:hypothetical protein
MHTLEDDDDERRLSYLFVLIPRRCRRLSIVKAAMTGIIVR